MTEDKRVEKVSLSGLLGTDSEQEQINRVNQLLQTAGAPVIAMTTILDTRSGKVDLLLNGKYSFDEIYTLLDIVRRDVNRREREAVLKQQEQK